MFNREDMKRRDAALRRVILPALAAAALSACQGGIDASMTKSQNAELTGDVAAYHLCVAHVAVRIDDGQSPIPEIADAAMDRCLPQAAEVSRLLDSA